MEKETEVENLIRVFSHRLAEISGNNIVSVSVFVNSQGYECEIKAQNSETLKARGISMRNLRGEFIE